MIEKEFLNILEKDPKTALSYIIFSKNNPDKYTEIIYNTCEKTILQDPTLALSFILQVTKKKYKKAEKILSTNIHTAYKYALFIKQRFRIAENIISQDPEYAFYYAKDVLKKRWKKAEKTISQNVVFSYRYAEDVIKKRFILGEKKISINPEYSYYYAINIIKGKLPTKMHNKMLAYAINENNNFVEKYFKFIKT